MAPGAVTSAIAGLGTILIIVCLWIWNGVRNLRTNFGDGYGQMRNHLKSKFRHELNEVVQRILDEVDFEELEDGERPVSVLTMEAIETQIERDELGDVEETLREFDRPSELLTEVKDTYDQAWRNFGIGGVGAYALVGTRILINGDAEPVAQFIVGLFTAIYVISGVMNLNQARESERELEDMVDTYREDY